jgi:Cu/Ag efflux pump CusA
MSSHCRVATIDAGGGQPQISRENLEPMVAVTGRIQGRGIGAAVGDVTKALDQPGTLGRASATSWAGSISSSRSPSTASSRCSARR